MDQILEGYVTDFSSSHGFNDLKKEEQFERFVNFCIVSKQYPRELDVENLSLGGSDDIGIDGAAITVNGNIIENEEEIDYLLNKNGYLEASFSFIQSKTSPKFKSEQVSTLIFGVKSFFDEVGSIPENESVKNLRYIKDKIYSNSISFDDLPVLNIYFVTTGEWRDPEQITGRANRDLAELENSNLFKTININYYDANRLKDTYRELRRKTVKEVDFPNHVSLPEIQKVRQSFIGSLSAKEYVKLISDSDGNLQKNLFEDNVRDFQGENKVNIDINRTLQNNELQAALSILNNGITIIAKKIDPVGTKLKITDFQIVNGCQSSHVLYENRDSLRDGTHVIVKFIETTDQELAAKVIKATNKQTIVTEEAFESLSPFHKDLEEFYNAKSSKITKPIFYERRSRQYDGSPSVKPSQVVTLANQISAYVATVLAQPHSTHRYYGELLDSNRSKIFKQSDNKDYYYLSSLMLNRMDSLFKSGKLPKFYKKFRYQILYVAHCYNEYLRKNTRANDYNKLIETYNEEVNYIAVFKSCLDLLEKTLNKSKVAPKDAIRSKDFSNEIRIEFEKTLKSL